jgi:hypothetical protein
MLLLLRIFGLLRWMQEHQEQEPRFSASVSVFAENNMLRWSQRSSCSSSRLQTLIVCVERMECDWIEEFAHKFGGCGADAKIDYWCLNLMFKAIRQNICNKFYTCSMYPATPHLLQNLSCQPKINLSHSCQHPGNTAQSQPLIKTPAGEKISATNNARCSRCEYFCKATKTRY